MIYNECPECGCEYVQDLLHGTDRHVRQECYYCTWVGEVREPETRYISGVRSMAVTSGGFAYDIFDCYGFPYTASRGYSTAEEARTKLKAELERLNSREGGSPWVGVLWPATVAVKGEIVR